MRNKIFVPITLLLFCACTANTSRQKFTISANFRNAPDQRAYLEQVYFDKKDPEILDSMQLITGRVKLSAKASEEGIFRIRLDKTQVTYYFINDRSDIELSADAGDSAGLKPAANTPANTILRNFSVNVQSRQLQLEKLAVAVDSLKDKKAPDSLVDARTKEANDAALEFEHFITASIDTLPDPVVAMLALSYSRDMDPSPMEKSLIILQKRFPAHRGINSMIAEYRQMMTAGSQAAQRQQSAETSGSLKLGDMAPDITMADSSGKPFSLSSLRGKYVLVDFWASWCSPCRAENPNVLANYEKYKSKNFTVLGVSLDENKKQWESAVKADKLSWEEISDLKGWESAAVSLYGFDAIPYNVLIDPQGKIIATSLTEEKLGETLQQVLK